MDNNYGGEYEGDVPTEEQIMNWNEANDYVNEGDPSDIVDAVDDTDDEKYRVVDLDDDEDHGGVFDTLAEARNCVRRDKLRAYAIWHKNVRVEHCDPYEGDDNRVKQALGMPCASDQIR